MIGQYAQIFIQIFSFKKNGGGYLPVRSITFELFFLRALKFSAYKCVLVICPSVECSNANAWPGQ